MDSFFLHIVDWLEVWALFIPLSVWLLKKKIPHPFNPLIAYLWIAIVLNTAIVIISELKSSLHLPHWLQSNNFLYNTHSAARLLCLSVFFIKLNQPFLTLAKKCIPVLFILFFITYFGFFAHFFYFERINHVLLSVESGLLLLLCLQYYFYLFLIEEHWMVRDTPEFWIVTGLGIFIVISFPIYIFYNQLVDQNITFGINIWQLQKLGFLIFCILTAIGLYKSSQ